MHKELNSIKGGNAALKLYWKSRNLHGPILLLNKDNLATLQAMADDPETDLDEELTVADICALSVTLSGGVKATTIVGALFNNKDDKKGHQDLHRIWFQPIKNSMVKFPDTGNTHNQSHCLAAAELITYLPNYRQFLESIQ